MNQESVCAAITSHHFVARDYQGWLWLVWGRSRLHIHPDDFGVLAEQLDYWKEHPYLPAVNADGIRIVCDGNNLVQIWVLDAGIILNACSFMLFADLVATARCALRTNTANASTATGFARIYVPFSLTPHATQLLN
jgi:hypothetical protein